MIDESTAPQDGGLGELDSIDRFQTITLPATEFELFIQGQFRTVWGARVQYYAPETYYKNGLENSIDGDGNSEFGRTRNITIRACLQDGNGNDQTCANYQLALYRPNVVLMHGLWSEQGTWSLGDNTPFTDLGFSEPLIPDYSSSNAAPFRENRYEPRDAMARLCFENFSAPQQILGARFDYIGHSMGGILGRVYLYTAAPYRTINRLYTLNTPHLGSPWANRLAFLRDTYISDIRLRTLRDAVVDGMSDAGNSISDGAIDDLAVGSEALSEIPLTPILSHALTGIGGLTIEELLLNGGLAFDIYTLLSLFIDEPFPFDDQHDWVVSRESQIGGIGSTASTIFDGLDSIHISATKSLEYANRLFCKGAGCPDDPFGFGRNDLMNKSGTGAFSIFPPPGDLMAQNIDALTESDGLPPETTVTENGINLVVSGGLNVQTGNTITITVESIPPFIADSVLLFSEIDIIVDDAGPLEFTLDVPQDLIGDLRLSAIAKDNQGNFATSPTIVLSSETSASLLEIRTNPESVYLGGSEDVRNLSVQGIYDDGVTRIITSSATGTTYQSSDPNIFIVSNEGTLRPVSNGNATLIVSNGTIQDSIPVEVMGTFTRVFIDGFESAPTTR